MGQRRPTCRCPMTLVLVPRSLSFMGARLTTTDRASKA